MRGVGTRRISDWTVEDWVSRWIVYTEFRLRQRRVRDVGDSRSDRGPEDDPFGPFIPYDSLVLRGRFLEFGLSWGYDDVKDPDSGIIGRGGTGTF